MQFKLKKVFLASAIFFGMLIQSSAANAICWWWQDCKAYQTQHPIVLVHGLSGFDSILGIDYFYGVKGELEERGATVYIPNVTAWEDGYVRGEQLLAYLEELQAITGAQKFNLIGHSLGSPTSRYVAGVRPDLVASVTSVNGANSGSGFADAARGIVPVGGGTEALIEGALNFLGDIIDALAGNSEYTQDALGAVTFLTTPGAEAFNDLFPAGRPTSSCGEGAAEVNGIRYWSWGGDFLLTNALDISDPFLAFTGATISGRNDGLVGSCQQRWGDVLRVNYNINHLDGVNLFFGLSNLFEVDPVVLFENHARRLKSAGL
ncbi:MULTISPECIES: triacylglycerol lipase [unclassified Oleiphilus]|nr:MULTISPECIES: triacylglycerol lipase [unclassified Oleiphilus]